MNVVELTRNDQVATVTINRPERRNAVTPEMLIELERIAHALSEDEEVRAVIYRAEGEDFSVGADLTVAVARREGSVLMRRRRAELGGRLMRAMQHIPQPTICALKGVATGAGACIASACDFRVAARDARIGYGEVRLGMNLMWKAVPLCVHLVGPARAKRMIMTGRLFDAATLLQWGFLDEVVERAGLDAAARGMADEFVGLPPNAVQMIKRSINHVAGPLDQAVMHMDEDQWLLSMLTQDHAEAVGAFLEKRHPTFTGN